MSEPTDHAPRRPRWPRLRDLGPGSRIGLAGFVLTMLLGTAVSGFFLHESKHNRDERAGLTVDDIKAHYHGIQTPPALLVALEEGHPDEYGPRPEGVPNPGEPWLPEADRQALIDWLTGDPDRLELDYDNFDLGAEMPEDIVYYACLHCHDATATGEHAAPSMPLRDRVDVLTLARGSDIRPVDLKILAASTHTHALAMSSMGICMFALLLLTSAWGWLKGLVIAVTGVGLLGDISSWWLIREGPWAIMTGIEEFAWLTAIGGGAFSGGIALMSVIVLVDLCLPRPKA